MSRSIPTSEEIGALIEEFQLRLCSGQETRSMSIFAEKDLTFSQVRVMMVLAYVDAAMPINEIAARLRLTFASAGRNVDSLVHDRLVKREEATYDRRVKLVQLTQEGRDLVSQHFECQRRVLTDFTRRLSEADRIRLADALGPVLEGDSLLPPRPDPTLTPVTSSSTVDSAENQPEESGTERRSSEPGKR